MHGALIEAEILTPPLPHVFPQLGPVLDTGTLPPVVSAPPKWFQNVQLTLLIAYMCHTCYSDHQLWSYSHFCDLSPFFVQLTPGFGHQCSTHGHVSTSQVISKCLACSPHHVHVSHFLFRPSVAKLHPFLWFMVNNLFLFYFINIFSCILPLFCLIIFDMLCFRPIPVWVLVLSGCLICCVHRK